MTRQFAPAVISTSSTSAPPRVRRAGRTRLAWAALLPVLLAMSGAAAISSGAAAQQTSGGEQATGEVRIVARKLANDKIEFALQQRGTDNTWGERLLPRQRFFPAQTTVGRWLASTPLTITIAATNVDVRIVAQRRAEGRTEFALQQRGTDNTWGERLLPRQRFFPAQTTVGRWLASTPLTITATQPATGFTAIAADDTIAGPRVIARKLHSGNIELGIGYPDGAETLPDQRLFDYLAAPVGKVQASSPVTITTSAGAVVVAITAHRTAAGRVAVNLATDDVDVVVLIPFDQASFDYAAATVGRWLQSAPAMVMSQRGEPFRPPASWFWPAGTCALGPPHDPGGPLLFCTPPETRTVREYLDEFVAMLTPWYPWIDAAMEWTNGYILATDDEVCGNPTAAGCYWRGNRRIYLRTDRLSGQPRLLWGEVLVHELAHAFDDMRGHPSEQYLLRYPAGLRVELFADTLAANTLGGDAASPYYAHSAYAFEAYWGRVKHDYRNDRGAFVADVDAVPEHPAMIDRIVAGWAVTDWCDVATCGLPRLAARIVWPSLASRQTAGTFNPFEGLPHVSEITVTIDFGDLDEELDRGERWRECLRDAEEAGRRVEAAALAADSRLVAAAALARARAEAAAQRECNKILDE